MRKLLQKTKSNFADDIYEAKKNDYDALILPLDQNEEAQFIIDASDMETIYDIASDSEWDTFVLIDFMRNEEKIIDLYEYEAA